MALVVRLTAIVTKELHRVVLGDVLRVVFGEILCGVPQGRNGLDVLVQAEGEAVLLLLVGHELERVVVDVAVQLDAGLDPPVPFVVEHQRVAEEEAGFVAAHVPVADRVAVDDLLLLHLLADPGGLVLVNPLRERPMLLGDLAVLGLARDERAGNSLELVAEVVVVEEDPVVVELAVEAVLDMTDRLCNLPDIRVAGQSDKGGIHAGARCSSGREHLLVWRRGCERRVGRERRVDGEGGIGRAGCGGVLVRRPARRRDGRRADEVEDDEGLRQLATAGHALGSETYKNGEDDVAHIALGAGHDVTTAGRRRRRRRRGLLTLPALF
jgi:hypothetical protein